MRPQSGRWVLLLAALGLVAGAAGCGAIGDSQQVVDRARLVNDFAERLNHAGELTYTAEYRLSSGETARIAQAQHPIRAAVTYPGGKLITTAERTADCRTKTNTCTLTPPPSPGADPASGLLDLIGDGGLILPTKVVGLLTAAALSSNAVIEQRDTTVGGEHAACVVVSGVENAAASAFTACITGAGVLGSFKGTVGGTDFDITLIRFQDTVPEDAFDLPAGATTAD